jgi:hypothetical protein
MLKEQMERNIFAYDDDIVVASRKKETQLHDLAETFAGHAKSTTETQSGQLHVWLKQGQSAGLSGTNEGNRS